MLQLGRTRRPRRAAEWTDAKAVTFVVTLAASRSVTLAAAAAGMSRKSAYALRGRDPGFAAAWNAALAAASPARVQGDKVHEVHDRRFAHPKGDKSKHSPDPALDAERRDRFFAALSKHDRDSRSSSLARGTALP